MRKLLQSNNDNLWQKREIPDCYVSSLPAKGILIICLSAMMILFIGMIAATPASADDVTYDYVSGTVHNQYNTPLNGVVVTLTYTYNDEDDVTLSPIISSDGSFNFTNVPQGAYFSVSAAWNGVTVTKNGFTDGSQRGFDLIIDTTSFWAYVVNQYEDPINYARVIFSYNNGKNQIRGVFDGEEDGMYFFDWVPSGVQFSLSASIDDKPYKSNVITGTSNDEMGEQDLMINMGGVVSPGPTQSPGATFVSSVPANVAVGDPIPISVTELNSGDVAWTDAEGFHLEVAGIDLYLPDDTVVQPGESYTFTDTFTGFSTPTSGFFACYMYQDDVLLKDNTGENSWGQQFFTVGTITVSPSPSPTPTGTPTPVPEPRLAWSIPDQSWYYNDTNPFPAISTVITPTPAPVVTPSPTVAPAITATPSPTVAPTSSPTPTPVPSSSENTSLLSNNWMWILLAVLVVAVVGTWYVTRHR